MTDPRRARREQRIELDELQLDPETLQDLTLAEGQGIEGGLVVGTVLPKPSQVTCVQVSCWPCPVKK